MCSSSAGSRPWTGRDRGTTATPGTWHSRRNRLRAVDSCQSGKPEICAGRARREPLAVPEVREDTPSPQQNAEFDGFLQGGQRGRGELADGCQHFYRSIAPARWNQGADGGAVIKGE